MVERKKEGEFIARPVFSRQVSELYYSIRHPDTGEWITNTYRVQGGEKTGSPRAGSTPSSTRSWRSSLTWTRSRLFSDGARRCPAPAAESAMLFHALIPVHQPKGLWDRVLGALDPDRWAQGRRRTWVIQGVHGTLCGVVEGVTAIGNRRVRR